MYKSVVELVLKKVKAAKDPVGGVTSNGLDDAYVW